MDHHDDVVDIDGNDNEDVDNLRDEDRIVGGYITNIENHPHQVKYKLSTSSIWTNTLVNTSNQNKKTI